jgi:hypothetical protein
VPAGIPQLRTLPNARAGPSWPGRRGPATGRHRHIVPAAVPCSQPGSCPEISASLSCASLEWPLCSASVLADTWQRSRRRLVSMTRPAAGAGPGFGSGAGPLVGCVWAVAAPHDKPARRHVLLPRRGDRRPHRSTAASALAPLKQLRLALLAVRCHAGQGLLAVQGGGQRVARSSWCRPTTSIRRRGRGSAGARPG